MTVKEQEMIRNLDIIHRELEDIHAYFRSSEEKSYECIVKSIAALAEEQAYVVGLMLDVLKENEIE